MVIQYLEPALKGVFGVGVLALIWRISVDSNKKASTIFKRFDQHKEEIDKKFVRKDVCKILHEQMSRDIEEIKLDVKLLLKRNGYKG